MKEEVLVLAGGGTGGHLFPGLAVAEAFAARGPERRVVFVGTGRPLERRAVSAAGFELRVVSARPLRGKNLKEQGLSLVSLPYALGQAALLLRELRPVAVVGLGGYAAGPVVMAAAGAGIPTAIMEQNALPGSTNRWLGRLRCVRRAYLSFGASRRFFAPEAVRVWGNPVRSVLAQVAGSPVPLDPLALLVLGGSQGAQRLNLSVPDALARLPGAAGLRVVHQTGDAMVEQVRRRYEELGLSATVVPFIDEMAEAYRTASLVLSRAGATTLAELAVVGRPALLVPFPFAIDDHQTKNAMEFERVGAAVRVADQDATPDHLALRLSELLADPARTLPPMGRAAQQLGRADATEKVVSDLEELIRVSR